MRSITILFLTVLLFSCNEDGSEIVFEGDLTISSQEQVNDFSITRVTGSLIIKGSDINDLSNLKSLEFVGESIRIFDTEVLVNLEGLENVQTDNNVSSDQFNLLIVRNNQTLEDINALQGFCQNTHSLIFNSNPSLTSEGLAQIRFNERIVELEITGCPLITNLDFLSNAKTAEGRFQIYSLRRLNDITGLSNLESVVEPDLSRLFSGLLLSDFPLLESLEGLNNLRVSSQIGLSKMPLITNLDALSNLQQGVDGMGKIGISENSNLTDFCGITTYANNIELWRGEYSITRNAYNPTFEELRSQVDCKMN